MVTQIIRNCYSLLRLPQEVTLNISSPGCWRLFQLSQEAKSILSYFHAVGPKPL